MKDGNNNGWLLWSTCSLRGVVPRVSMPGHFHSSRRAPERGVVARLLVGSEVELGFKAGLSQSTPLYLEHPGRT